MISVNFSPVAQQQNTPTFRGNKNIIGKYGKTFLEREVLRTPNNRNPHAYIFSPLYHIKNWFKELKLRISGTTTKELIEISTPQYNNKETKALMEFYAALYEYLFKK